MASSNRPPLKASTRRKPRKRLRQPIHDFRGQSVTCRGLLSILTHRGAHTAERKVSRIVVRIGNQVKHCRHGVSRT